MAVLGQVALAASLLGVGHAARSALGLAAVGEKAARENLSACPEPSTVCEQRCPEQGLLRNIRDAPYAKLFERACCDPGRGDVCTKGCDVDGEAFARCSPPACYGRGFACDGVSGYSKVCCWPGQTCRGGYYETDMDGDKEYIAARCLGQPRGFAGKWLPSAGGPMGTISADGTEFKWGPYQGRPDGSVWKIRAGGALMLVDSIDNQPVPYSFRGYLQPDGNRIKWTLYGTGAPAAPADYIRVQ